MLSTTNKNMPKASSLFKSRIFASIASTYSVIKIPSGVGIRIEIFAILGQIPSTNLWSVFMYLRFIIIPARSQYAFDCDFQIIY